MNSKIPWILVVALGGICAFLSTGEIGALVRDVPRVVTREVVREVPKEIIKEVVREVPREIVKEVPAAIPADYQLAKWFYDSYQQSVFFTDNDVLKGRGPIAVVVVLDAKEKSLGVTEDELKNSIELALRKNGVPVKNLKESSNALIFLVNGILDEDKRLSYSVELKLTENVRIFGENGFKTLTVAIWQDGYIGVAGKLKTREALTGSADKLVTKFSNEYLGANTK